MLSRAVADYIALKHALGFSYRREAGMLRSFTRFAEQRGDTHVRTATVLEWTRGASSLKERDLRLKKVVAFAKHACAEDPRHEVPPSDIYGYRRQRPTPFIYTPEQVTTLLRAAAGLGPSESLRPHTYRTLFGLLACAGLRISEALRLRVHDITNDGLVIRRTKFQKSRLVPLHVSAAEALSQYLRRRARRASQDHHVFIDNHGQPLRYSAVYPVFRKLIDQLGLRRGPHRPTMHSLRHTFAVRALEHAPSSRDHVGTHLVALATYLGHSSASATYWYLEATPELLKDISIACELHGVEVTP